MRAYVRMQGENFGSGSSSSSSGLSVDALKVGFSDFLICGLHVVVATTIATTTVVIPINFHSDTPATVLGAQGAVAVIRQDPKILLIGSVASLFEGGSI